MTTELLTVRLNCVNEILSLQEEKLLKKVSVCSLGGRLELVQLACISKCIRTKIAAGKLTALSAF